jgi:DNA-binding response OmpR family regulator
MAIQAQREQQGATTRAPIVLVVESNVLVRLALAEYLRDSGYATLEAGDTDEAIQLLESSGRAIGVVFSEIDVPGRIDGYGLARWIRNKGLGTRVLLTSVASRGVEGAEAASEDLVPKPYTPAEIKGRIESLMAGPSEGDLPGDQLGCAS